MSTEGWIAIVGIALTLVLGCGNVFQAVLGRHHKRVFRAKVEELYMTLVCPIWYAKHLTKSTKALAEQPGQITPAQIRQINIRTGQLQGAAISVVLGLQGFGERYLDLSLRPWRQVVEEAESRGDFATEEQ